MRDTRRVGKVTRSRWLQGTLVLVCLALVGASLLDYAGWRAGQRVALQLLDDHGLGKRHPLMAGEVARRYDPLKASLRVALTLLDEELDRSWLATLASEERQRQLGAGVERLRQARSIARQSWPRRPASWQAALIVGGASYLELYRSRDPRFMSERTLWEGPLRAAHELGPAQTAPLRFLAAAYLGNWSAIPADHRLQVVELLRRGFADRVTFRLLISEWLRVAPSLRQALELVPPEPWAWKALQEIFFRRRDWQRHLEARRRWYDSLGTAAERSLRAAEVQLAGGAPRAARAELLSLLHELPRTVDFASAMQHLLERLPPGPVAAPHAAAFATWLDWALESCLVPGCPFSPAAMARLALLSGNLEPPQRAQAALMAGDLPQAELWERRTGLQPADEWAPYHLLKAEALAERGALAEAEASLDKLPAAWRSSPRAWLARARLAELTGGENGVAAAALAELRRSSWRALSWSWHQHTASVLVLPASAASGLSIQFVEAPADGTLLEVLWDGELVEMARVHGGDTLRLPLSVTPDIHRLSLRFPHGSPARPGLLSLL